MTAATASEQRARPAESTQPSGAAPFLDEAQKRDILYNNAARFLRLSAEQIAADHRPL